MKRPGIGVHLHVRGTARNGKESLWAGEHVGRVGSIEATMCESFRNDGPGPGGAA